MQRQDYIERMIAQIAEAIGRALGFATTGRPLEAQGELDAAWSASIGLRRADVQRLDVATLRSLLGAKRAAAATLLEAEADVKQLRGDLGSESALRTLATMLRQ
jgi:hypothetical protein